VFKNGSYQTDQRGIVTIECRSLSVTIIDPLARLPDGFGSSYLKKYTDELILGKKTKDEFAYTYHERIFKKWGNQVENAIKILDNSKETRRAIIALWDPATDLSNPSPPCLNMIDLIVRDEKLEMHVLFRSHHLATVTKDGKLLAGEGAFVPNIYALAKLQEKIAEEIGINRGPLVLTDFSGHLYVSGV